MAVTFFCTIAVALYFVGIVKTPHEKKENGFELVIIGSILLMIFCGVGAACYTLIGIPVSLLSTSFTIVFMDAVLWGRCFWKKILDRCYWPRKNGIALFIVIVPVIGIAIYCFGIQLNLNYGAVDPARYMQYATELLQTKRVSGEFMTTLLNATFIEFFQPFLPAVSYYRAVVLADIVIHILSSAMFWLLVSHINHGKLKWCNALLTLFYFAGYPLYNLCYGSFFHWVDGMLMTMFLVYGAWILTEEKVSHDKGIVILLAGAFGLLCFYPFLFVIVGPMLLPDTVIWIAKNVKKMPRKQCILFCVLIVVVLGIGALIAGQRIGHSLDGFFHALSAEEGLAYREPYMDFLLFVPVFLTLLGQLHRHKKENRIIARMIIAASIFTTIWLVAYLTTDMVSYYYYRVYYVLWFLAWIMTAQVISIMARERKVFEIGVYSIFCGIVVLIGITGFNEKLWLLDDMMYLDEEHRHTSLTPLYEFNAKALQSNYKAILNEEELQICSYVIENFEDESVPVVNSTYSVMQMEWYRGITGQLFPSFIYDTRYYPIWTVLNCLQEMQVKHFTIFKGDPIYERYFPEIFSNYQVVTENESAVIFEVPEGGWTFAVDTEETVSEPARQFYTVLRDWGVKPLIVNQGHGYDEKYFEIYTGASSVNWISQLNPEDFIASTYRLNVEETEFLFVVKDCDMYRYNKEYFDAQIIICENEYGLLIQHAGDGWMPSQQQ